MSKMTRDIFSLPGDTVASLEIKYLSAGKPGVPAKSSPRMVLSANSCPTKRALITGEEFEPLFFTTHFVLIHTTS